MNDLDSDHLIASANARLKALKVKLVITRKGDSLSLRGTLPPRSGTGKATRSRIPLGVSATCKGIEIAERKAILIRSQIDEGTFNWGDWIEIQSPQCLETITEIVAGFEGDYFTRRQRDSKSELTYKTDYHNIFKKLPGDEILTPQLAFQLISSTHPDSRIRKRTCIALGALCKFAKVNFDPSPYAGKYGIATTTERRIPTDDEIVARFGEIPHGGWRWVYGMLATYGLRNHEVFRLDFKQIANGTQIITVLRGKTGSRMVFPIYPEWWELFNLQAVELPKLNLKRTNDQLGHQVTSQFSRYGIPFTPYDLRHAWAVRSLIFGLDSTMAAQQMGHSLAVHTKLYHKWIQEHHYKQAFKKLMERSERPEPS